MIIRKGGIRFQPLDSRASLTEGPSFSLRSPPLTWNDTVADPLALGLCCESWGDHPVMYIT